MSKGFKTLTWFFKSNLNIIYWVYVICLNQLIKFNYHKNTLRKLLFPVLHKLWCSTQNLPIYLESYPQINLPLPNCWGHWPSRRVASSMVISPLLFTSNDLSIWDYTDPYLSTQFYVIIKHPIFKTHCRVNRGVFWHYIIAEFLFLFTSAFFLSLSHRYHCQELIHEPLSCS